MKKLITSAILFTMVLYTGAVYSQSYGKLMMQEKSFAEKKIELLKLKKDDPTGKKCIHLKAKLDDEMDDILFQLESSKHKSVAQNQDYPISYYIVTAYGRVLENEYNILRDRDGCADITKLQMACRYRFKKDSIEITPEFIDKYLKNDMSKKEIKVYNELQVDYQFVLDLYKKHQDRIDTLINVCVNPKTDNQRPTVPPKQDKPGKGGGNSGPNNEGVDANKVNEGSIVLPEMNIKTNSKPNVDIAIDGFETTHGGTYLKVKLVEFKSFSVEEGTVLPLTIKVVDKENPSVIVTDYDYLLQYKEKHGDTPVWVPIPGKTELDGDDLVAMLWYGDKLIARSDMIPR